MSTPSEFIILQATSRNCNLFVLFSDAKHTKILLLLDSSLNVHVFPRTTDAIEIVSKASSSIFFFLADKEKNNLKGYMLLSDTQKNVFHVRDMWNVNFPYSQQTISNIGKCNKLEEISH